jgi:diguanylate cyclase (GGDEF)-like protein/PAS domain S-box-containing protein
VHLGALSRDRFKRRSDILEPGGAMRDASAAWWWSAYALSIAAAIFGAALTWLAWYEAFQNETRLGNQELGARASDHFLALQNGIDQYLSDISALRAAFQASEHGISRREFQSFSDDLFHDKTAIFGTSWIPRVARSERSAHEREAARDGLPGYEIRSIAADGNLYPAKDADEYFPIFYSSRRDFGASVLGFDLNDGGIRQHTLERARDTDQPAASAGFILRRGDGNRNGFLVALPVYRTGLPHANVEDRRRNFIGLVQGVFQTGAMIETILATMTTPNNMDLYFFAADSGDGAAPLYVHRSRPQVDASAPLSRAAIAQGLHWSGELKVADRGWTFIAAPLPGGPGTAVHSGSRMILVAGALISAMMAAYFWTVGRNTRRLQLSNRQLSEVNGALAQARVNAERATQDAQAAHAHLVEAFEVVPEGIALMDADDRLVLWNSQYAETYRATGDAIAAGSQFKDILRKGLARGQYADALGKEEEWLAARLAGHALPSNRQEQLLSSGRYIVVEERRTANGGSIGVRIDVTEMKQREESFRLLFKGNPVPMWVVDIGTLKFLAVNSAAVAHYGYSRDEFLQMTAFDLRPADDHGQPMEYIQPARTGQANRIRRHRKADGTDILVSVYHADLTYAGRAARLCAVVDVTERTRAEEKLTEQKMQIDMAINNMSQGLLMFDSQARLVLCNDRYVEMYDLPADAVKPGCTLRELVDLRKDVGSFSGDAEQYCCSVLEDVAKGTTWSRTIKMSGGRTIHVVNRPCPGGGWVATHEDITEREQAQARIEYLAHHDLLTDLPNRAAFNDFLAKAIERAAGRDEKIAVVCIDLDRFKELNDVFGHAVGDGLLRALSTRLKDAAAGAFLARLGGDEFSLVVTEGPEPAAAEHLATRLLAATATDIEVDGHLLRIGLSTGVAIYPTDGADASTLLANADAGLYRAKREGRGSVRFFEARMDHRLRERRALQHDLGSAVGHDEVRLFYQPQASIDGEIVGFEALARWQHPTRGMIAPGEFISLAEHSGVIVQIGEWVLREACREAASWVCPLRVAINLSPVQFRHGDLPNLVHAILLETGLAPRRLELEITESVLMDDFARAISILRRLKALGVRIAMDDFGTGYSSLSYIQAFPFDKIKIDQAFVSNLDKNPQSAAIIRAIIGLGRALSLPVTAEGVETKEQLAFLANESCDEIQGYLIGRPLPIEEYAEATGKATQRGRKISCAV